ncbi:MAG: CHAT domain-containing protein [Pseudonocardiales bacterium]
MARSAITAAPADAEVLSSAHRALGIVAAVRGDPEAAVERLRESAQIADSADLPTRACEARGTLAYLLLLTRGAGPALVELDRAEATQPTGVSAARLHMQRGLILHEIGREDEARARFDTALAMVQEAGGDDLLEGDVRTNRSITRTNLRDWDGALDDLRHAEGLYTRTGHHGRTAMVYGNRARAEVLRGDLPAALAAFDEAAARFKAAGMHSGLVSVDRSVVLLSAGLVVEARLAAQAAVAEFASQRNAVDLVQARLALAEAALLAGDLASVRSEAQRVRRAARQQGRPRWAALAGYLQVRARWLDGDCGRASLNAARRTARELSEAGWVVQSLDVRLVVARIALSLGRQDEARRALTGLGSARRSGPAELRARAWHAEAIVRRSYGDRGGAAKAVRTGLAVIDQFQASLGATDMRTHAGAHAAELAQLGLELALETRRPESIFAAAEHGRAGALRFRPARPPDDDALVADLAELREVVTKLGSGEAAPGPLLARQAAIECAIRDRARHAAGSKEPARREPTMTHLRAALGGSTLVEYLDLGGDLHAVAVRAGHSSYHRLGPVAVVEESIDSLRTGLRFLAHGAGSARSTAAVSEMIDRAAQELDARLLAPVLDHADDSPLVVVPTGALHALPWSALPSCAARAVSVAPSAALWHRAATHPRVDAGPAVLAHGPGLSHAGAEIRALARVYPDATCLTGGNARVSTVLSALDGAGVGHLAAHGHFRADNAMFSELQFADGPLTVYDLERLAVPPQHVVLASCDSGLASVRTGDELIGLAAAMLALGTVNLVAALVPVPDDASRGLMLAFHRHLTAGRGAAEALQHARHEMASRPGAPSAASVAAAGFVCFGAG